MKTEKKKAPPKSKDSVPLDKKLAAWLKEQAAKLKNLEGKSRKLKLDFVQNAKEKGDILAKVRKRITTDFKTWVIENTDIAYSTAQLWMDVAQNYSDVKKRFDSNPVELTLTQIRDAIRDARQERGEGKPGSGKRKASTTASPSTAGTAEADSDDGAIDPDDQVDAAATDEEDAPDKTKWEREVAKAEAEAAQVEDGGKKKIEPPAYKVTVMVFSEDDQATMQQALVNWSPVNNKPVNTKQFRSVIVHAPPADIGALLEQLGKTLAKNQPKKLRVSIEI